MINFVFTEDPDQAAEKWYEYEINCMSIDKSEMKVRNTSKANENCPRCTEEKQIGEWPFQPPSDDRLL